MLEAFETIWQRDRSGRYPLDASYPRGRRGLEVLEMECGRRVRFALQIEAAGMLHVGPRTWLSELGTVVVADA